MSNEFDAGMGTTPGMWESLSDVLSENEITLPDSLNAAIYALWAGKAEVSSKEDKVLRQHQRYAIEIERLKSAIRAMQEIAVETLTK